MNWYLSFQSPSECYNMNDENRNLENKQQEK